MPSNQRYLGYSVFVQSDTENCIVLTAPTHELSKANNVIFLDEHAMKRLIDWYDQVYIRREDAPK